MIKPLLKYVGSKREVIQKIYKHFPKDIKEYREPMVGSGAMLLGLLQSRKRVDIIRIGDLDPMVVAFWRQITNNPDELKKSIELDIQAIRMLNTSKYIEEYLDAFLSNEVEIVSRYIVANKLRQFGNYGSINYLALEKNLKILEDNLRYNLYGISNLVGSDIDIRFDSYEWALQEDGEDVLVFLDHPYYNVSDKNGYYKNHKQFDYDKFKKDLLNSKHRFIMTIDVSDFSEDLKRYFKVYEYEIYYRIANKWEKEYIVMNY